MGPLAALRWRTDGGGVEPLVSVDWLAEHGDDPDVRVFDVTVQVSRV